MRKQNDGGPVFPEPVMDFLQYRGMTLRDYFAAKAMQGLLANNMMGDASLHECAPDWLSDISVGAYEFADAMLRAREAS
ncbi:hypothetical protein [Citrobacter cronae]|nr:hypothetical protein [Citrobacter cronae]MBJ8396871.1 hypothetical protein [Citrobacter cronae]MBJ8410998.1 hypothetical protein [Citrobacter cronae]